MLVGESGVNTFSYLEYQASDGTSEVFVLDANAPAISGGIVTLVGTDKNDKLKLNYNSNPGDLKGLAGDDRLHGGQSDDYLDGGTGDDYLVGNQGEDTLSGGEGEDYLEGGLGSDYMAGGAGDDVYVFEINYGSFLITPVGTMSIPPWTHKTRCTRTPGTILLVMLILSTMQTVLTAS